MKLSPILCVNYSSKSCFHVRTCIYPLDIEMFGYEMKESVLGKTKKIKSKYNNVS